MHPHCFCKLRVGYNGCIHHQRDILRRCATLLQAFHLLPPSSPTSLLHSRAKRLHTEYNLKLGCSLEGGETKPDALLCQHGNTVLFLFLLVVVFISFKRYPHYPPFFFIPDNHVLVTTALSCSDEEPSSQDVWQHV